VSKEEEVDGGLALAGCFAVPVAMILKGLVLVKLWAWFVAPLVHRDVGVAQAIGISLCINLVMGQARGSQNKSEQVEGLVMMFLVPVLCLALGALVHWFGG
jgi:hypothetical protein